ncbi:Diaminopimelate epimerase [Pseudomonas fluorescens]|nr:Diaminopimelate epimerase [Pseudomonas fluorescens]
MSLRFHKMHANGDDLVIVDARNSPNPMTGNIARRMGDRNRGVGFNQLVVVLDCDDADARLMFWSADGSMLDVCGSATRGVADMLMHEANITSIALRTNRGLLTCERTSSFGDPSAGNRLYLLAASTACAVEAPALNLALEFRNNLPRNISRCNILNGRGLGNQLKSILTKSLFIEYVS